MIKAIRLAGWRSYSHDHETEFCGLGSVNLLIGPNNAGKSNLGRFLVSLQSWCSLMVNGIDFTKLGAPDDRSWERCLGTSVAIDETDPWMGRTDLPITATIELHPDVMERIPERFRTPFLRDPAKANDSPPAYVKPDRILVHMTLTPQGDRKARFRLIPVLPGDVDLYRTHEGEAQLWDISGAKYVGPGEIYASDTDDDLMKAASNAFDKLYYSARHVGPFLALELRDAIREMQALRHYARSPVAPRDGSADGTDVRTALHALSRDNGRKLEWVKTRKFLTDALALVLDEESVQIDIQDSDVVVTVPRKSAGGLPLTLGEHGVGTAELFMLLGWLRLHKDRPHLVFLEEPEAHLHSSAVIALLKLIQRELPGHQVLATSHSVAVIDDADDRWNLYRVSKSIQGHSVVEPLIGRSQKVALLDELGMRASQMFLANTTIWVEGPSDILYLRALLEDRHPKLLMGRDYTFAMYGGASGAHLSLLPEDEDDTRLVRLFEMSHNPLVVGDRDSDSAETDSERMKALRKAAAEAGVGGHRVLTTPGREIENIIAEAEIQKALAAVRPGYLIVDKKKTPDLTYANDYSLGEFGAYDVVVSELVEDAALRSRVKENLARAKVALARQVIESGIKLRASGEKFIADLAAAVGVAGQATKD